MDAPTRPDWAEELATKVKDALGRGEACRIVVPTTAQAELGRRAAERLARTMGGDPALITFDVSPSPAQGEG
jgi:hypothetical protein